MLGRHVGLQPVALGERRGDRGRHPLEQVERLDDLVEVPPRAVLVGQQHEPPVGVDARVAAGVLEEQQGEQGPQHRLVGAQGESDPHEPHGLPDRSARSRSGPLPGA